MKQHNLTIKDLEKLYKEVKEIEDETVFKNKKGDQIMFVKVKPLAEYLRECKSKFVNGASGFIRFVDKKHDFTMPARLEQFEAFITKMYRELTKSA